MEKFEEARGDGFCHRANASCNLDAFVLTGFPNEYFGFNNSQRDGSHAEGAEGYFGLII
jgi:hypothetical protein